MLSLHPLAGLLATLALSSAPALALPRSLSSRADSTDYTGFTNPNTVGGLMLTVVNGTYPAGLGEPLNIIISSSSNAAVLVDSKDNGGFKNWALSVNHGGECLGQNTNSTEQQKANVDGKGNTSAIATLRYNYGDTFLGTCQETKQGGDHFRYWKQNSTGAIFLAASIEKSLTESHDILNNGYNLGRDQIASYATSNSTIDTANLKGGETFEGSSSYGGWTYKTSVTYLTGLLSNSSDGINHYLSVENSTIGTNAIDGLVALLDIQISQAGTNTTSSSSTTSDKSSALSSTSQPVSILLSFVGVASLSLL